RVHHASQGQRAPAKVYDLQHKDTASVNTIAGMLSILHHNAHVLFDTRANFSCVSECFVSVCGVPVEFISESLSVSTPLGNGSVINRICRNVDIEIEGRHLPVNLVVLDMSNFDVILGVYWLKMYQAAIDCKNLVVEFNLPIGDHFAYKLDVSSSYDDRE